MMDLRGAGDLGRFFQPKLSQIDSQRTNSTMDVGSYHGAKKMCLAYSITLRFRNKVFG